jgi:hypothetical protein
MTARGVAVLASAAMLCMGLAGCAVAQTAQGVAEECGGRSAGLTVEKDDIEVLVYREQDDPTGDGWLCMLTKTVPDDTERYTIALGLDSGEMLDGDFNGWTYVYGTTSQGIQLRAWR